MLEALAIAVALAMGAPAVDPTTVGLPVTAVVSEQKPIKPQQADEAEATQISEPGSLLLLGAALVITGILVRNIEIV